MEYIVSRGDVPNSAQEMEKYFWFSMWNRRFWPYRGLKVGDVLYWYETKSKRIVWKSCVTKIDKFPYASKEMVAFRLKNSFSLFDYKDEHFVSAAPKGFCLAWKVSDLEKVSFQKPSSYERFPRLGWLNGKEKIARQWLSLDEPTKAKNENKISTRRHLLKELHELDKKMAGLTPKRVHAKVLQMIRRDSGLIKSLKKLRDYRCQFPGCEIRIQKKDGSFYIEVAHIKPVRRGGKSVIGNLLVLCPNHHKELDYGDLQILEQTSEPTANNIKGKLNGKYFEMSLHPAEKTESNP